MRPGHPARLRAERTRDGENRHVVVDQRAPRVFVAGDASRDAQFVVVAAAEGIKAAVAINKALQRLGVVR